MFLMKDLDLSCKKGYFTKLLMSIKLNLHQQREVSIMTKKAIRYNGYELACCMMQC